MIKNQYTLDDLRAFAAYEGQDPTASLAADIAKAGLVRIMELEVAIKEFIFANWDIITIYDHMETLASVASGEIT